MTLRKRARAAWCPRHLDRTLGDAAVANLHRWYEEDFRFLELCDRVIREHPHLRSGSSPFSTGIRRLFAPSGSGGPASGT